MSLRRRFLTVLLILPAITLASCSSSSSKSGSAGGSGSGGAVKLTGSGASFPYPLYDRWFGEYKKAHPSVSINYQGVGSGAGITQFTEKTVDFAASDAAMTPEEIAKVPEGVVLLPMTAGSIVITYNVPGAPDKLKLSREAYVGMFLGKITNWNDPAIAKTNEGVKLPDLKVVPVYRADGSGTTFVFTQHLSTVSAEWKAGPGTGKSVNWPASGSVGGKQNAGVAQTVTQTPGAVGYVELGYVKHAKLNVAALENKDGSFVAAETKTSQAALNSTPMTDNLIVWLPDPAGKDSYPITSYTWLLAYKTYKDPAKAKALKDVIRYGLTEGQKVSEEMGYVPFSDEVAQKILAHVDDIKP